MERCKNVQLNDPRIIQSCRQATVKATLYWRSEGFNWNIVHIVNYRFGTGSPPRFVEPESLRVMRQLAAKKLSVKVAQIDGVSPKGLS